MADSINPFTQDAYTQLANAYQAASDPKLASAGSELRDDMASAYNRFRDYVDSITKGSQTQGSFDGQSVQPPQVQEVTKTRSIWVTIFWIVVAILVIYFIYLLFTCGRKKDINVNITPDLNNLRTFAY